MYGTKENPKAPVAPDVSWGDLAEFELDGAGIRSALLRAATAAALRTQGRGDITRTDLRAAAEEELAHARSGPRAGMYV